MPVDRHAEITRELELWKTAERERDRHLIRLWELCEPEIEGVLNKAASKEGISRDMWLERRGLDFDDVRHAVFFAVLDAIPKFDPEHTSGASFATYAFKYIKGEVAGLARCSPHLAGARDAEALEGEDVDEVLREEEPSSLAGIVELTRKHSVPVICERVYQRTKDTGEHPSEILRRIAEGIEEEFSQELERDVMVQALHAMFIAQSIRAEDREGKMVKVSKLAQILRARAYRQAAGMKKRTYSDARLQREFGISDKTVKSWRISCEEQGIVADDLSPETLTRLARIMTPRRGPTAG